MTLPALLARLSEAKEGSRELDSAIHLYRVAEELVKGRDGVEVRRELGHWENAPPYTTSLDAALTLVPEGWEWLTRGNARPFANVMTGAQPVVGEGFTQSDDSYTAYAATAALALCIAALRARSTP